MCATYTAAFCLSVLFWVFLLIIHLINKSVPQQPVWHTLIYHSHDHCQRHQHVWNVYLLVKIHSIFSCTACSLFGTPLVLGWAPFCL